MTNTENLVQLNTSKQIITTSSIVAETFSRRHDNVLRDIKTLITSLQEMDDAILATNPFKEVKYLNPQNKQQYTEYELNRDGFTLLAMGYTGREALKFKVNYIKAFNNMEAQLKAIRNAPAQTTKLNNNTRLKLNAGMKSRLTMLVGMFGSGANLANAAKVQHSTFNWIVSGSANTILEYKLKSIIENLGISESWLLHGTGEMYSTKKIPSSQIIEQKKEDKAQLQMNFAEQPKLQNLEVERVYESPSGNHLKISCETSKFETNKILPKIKRHDKIIFFKQNTFTFDGIYLLQSKTNENLYSVNFIRYDLTAGNLYIYTTADHGEKHLFDPSKINILGICTNAIVRV